MGGVGLPGAPRRTAPRLLNNPFAMKRVLDVFCKEGLGENTTFRTFPRNSEPLQRGSESFFEGWIGRKPTFRRCHPFGSYNIKRGLLCIGFWSFAGFSADFNIVPGPLGLTGYCVKGRTQKHRQHKGSLFF